MLDNIDLGCKEWTPIGHRPIDTDLNVFYTFAVSVNSNGYNMGTIPNCVNRASVKDHYAFGGIVGFNYKGSGSIENSNRLFREFYPKKTDLALVNQKELTNHLFLIINRPRKCLDWKSPIQAFLRKAAHLT